VLGATVAWRALGEALGAGALALAIVALAVSGRARADAPIAARGIRADGIAAVVGDRSPGPNATLVLRSDVALYARIILSGRIEGSASTTPLPVDLLAATLEQIVGEVLIAREAERVRVAPPNEADLAHERERLFAEAGGEQKLRELVRRASASVDEIEAIITRRALVGAFLRLNLEGTTVITDAEVDRAYEQPDQPFADQPIEEAREPLRAWLARQALDRAVRRWVSVLHARTTVKVLVEYGR
jgi:hypothetical protein